MTLTVLIAVTHLLGVGHLSRAAAIGRALARAGERVTLVSGGAPVPMIPMEGLGFVQLEPVHCVGTDFRTLLGRDGAPISDDLRKRRRDRLLEAFDAARPDVVITELYPFGRRQLADEFTALLEAAGGRRPRPAVLASVRDILNPPTRPGREAEAMARLSGCYDRVLVHGDPAVAPLGLSWPVETALERRLIYTGYVAEPAGAQSPALSVNTARAAQGEILVSGGGSEASLPLFEAALSAAALGATEPILEELSWRILVGWGVAQPRFDALLRRAESVPGGRVRVERARKDFPSLLARAAVSVSQAGYNTMADLVRTDTPAVVVPFEQGQEAEQGLRAAGLARIGRVSILSESELAPRTLLNAIARARATPPVAIRIDLGGLEGSVDAIRRVAGRVAAREEARLRLVRALDRLDASGRHLPVWWRDDDAVSPGPALDRLLALAQAVNCPVSLAVIPAKVAASLAERLAGIKGVDVLQHGWAHANHAPEGARKRELGDRLAARILPELARGRAILERLFGAQFVPILVPPWNRIAPELVPLLAEHGYLGLSGFGDRQSACAAKGLVALPTHLDPIEWRGGGGLADEAKLWDQLARRVEFVLRPAAGAPEPFGLLTHHLVHDGWIWRFCEDVLTLLAGRPGVRFTAARDLVLGQRPAKHMPS